MASIIVPFLYIILVFGGLFVFSIWYKRRLASRGFEPYFPRHRERDIYVSLLQRTDPPTPEHLLKAALVRRAMIDVQRIMRIREDKPALQNLLQKGSIGDDLFNSLLAAEKELEAEILEVAAEANTFVEGWGTVIFQTATEMIHNEKMRAMVENTHVMRAEKEQKYSIKSNPVALPRTLSPSSLNAVPPASPAPSTPQTLVSAKTTNGLAPPPSAGMESVASSDGEAPLSPTTPRTPKSAKKTKKRK